LIGGLLYLVQQGGAIRAAAPQYPILAVPNVTAQPSMTSVPTSCYVVWHYNLPLHSKGLKGNHAL